MAPESPVADESTATLDYLEAMLGQLRSLAEAERYDMLAYLIGMAQVEAADIGRGIRPSTLRKEKGDGTS